GPGFEGRGSGRRQGERREQAAVHAPAVVVSGQGRGRGVPGRDEGRGIPGVPDRGGCQRQGDVLSRATGLVSLARGGERCQGRVREVSPQGGADHAAVKLGSAATHAGADGSATTIRLASRGHGSGRAGGGARATAVVACSRASSMASAGRPSTTAIRPSWRASSLSIA